MVSAFPTPVLSVTADAVRDLEGRDALSGLWTLFTKCKESLQDGRRLENISWRLWYREMMLENHSRESVPLVHNLDCSEEEKAVEEVEQPIAIAIVDQIYTHQPSDSVAIPPPYSPHQPQTGASVPNATSSSQGLVSSGK
ncbi:hypothetical protein BDZ97DRAFT_1650304 [Flammula alnicola]|nr:hypothetical protein BDZ97DRAFT_1650304 [Flammula alnicola]